MFAPQDVAVGQHWTNFGLEVTVTQVSRDKVVFWSDTLGEDFTCRCVVRFWIGTSDWVFVS